MSTDYKQEIEEILTELVGHYPECDYNLSKGKDACDCYTELLIPKLSKAITHLINKAEKEAYKKGFMEAHNTHMEITDKLDRIKELEK